ncbi:hypothetical protein RQP46_010057 [Phenoliferia psychrophenolica]
MPPRTALLASFPRLASPRSFSSTTKVSGWKSTLGNVTQGLHTRTADHVLIWILLGTVVIPSHSRYQLSLEAVEREKSRTLLLDRYMERVNKDSKANFYKLVALEISREIEATKAATKSTQPTRI